MLATHPLPHRRFAKQVGRQQFDRNNSVVGRRVVRRHTSAMPPRPNNAVVAGDGGSVAVAVGAAIAVASEGTLLSPVTVAVVLPRSMVRTWRTAIRSYSATRHPFPKRRSISALSSSRSAHGNLARCPLAECPADALLEPYARCTGKRRPNASSKPSASI